MLLLASDLSGVASIIGTVSLGISIAALFFTLLGILLGLKRGILHSLLRLGAAILAAVSSLIATRMLRDTVAGLIAGLLESFKDDPTVQDLIAASPTANELITNLPGALAAPLLFFGIFLILNLVFYGIYKILKHLTVFGKKLLSKTIFGKLQIGRLIGAGISLCASFLIVICVLSPFSGYISFADDIVHELAAVEIEPELDATLDDVSENILPTLNDNPALKVSGVLTGTLVFDTVTSYDMNGETVVWSEEIAYIAETYTILKPLFESEFNLSAFGKTEADALRAFSAHFPDSHLLPHMIAEVLPYMASKWNANLTFCGIENPVITAGPELQPLMSSLFVILETTNYDTLQSDLDTVVELVATLAESGTFAVLGDDITAEDIIATLSKEGLVSGLVETIYENERMRPLVADISNLGFNAIGNSLGIPEDDKAVRDSLNADLNHAVSAVTSIEDYDQKIATLSSDLTSIFAKYGVEADKETANLYAACIVGVGPIAGDNDTAVMVDYFSIISAALAQQNISINIVRPVFSSSPVNAKVQAAVEAYLATQGNDAAKKALLLSNQLKGEDGLPHAVITFEDIRLSAEEMKEMTKEDMSKQAKSLEDIIVVLSSVMVFGDDGSFSLDINKLDPDALADALFHLASTGTDSEGHEIHNLAHAITGVVKYSLYQIGIDSRAANELVNHMTSEKSNGKNPLSSAIAVLNIVQSDKELTKEDIKENITTLVSDLDAESAKVLADCISPNLLNSFGSSALPADQTDALVNVTKDIITNFGESADQMTPEQLEAETAYMQTIFDLAINAGDAENRGDTIFTSDESENSTLDMTADGFVDTIKHSTIIQSTVLSETESMKTAVNNSMGDADKAELIAAIEKDSELSPELKNALTDIFGLGSIGQ